MPRRFALPRHFRTSSSSPGVSRKLFDQIFVRVRRLEQRIVLAQASPPRNFRELAESAVFPDGNVQAIQPRNRFYYKVPVPKPKSGNFSIPR